MKCERLNCEGRQRLLTRDLSQNIVTILQKHEFCRVTVLFYKIMNFVLS